MAKKRNSKLPKNDFAPEEELEVCGFTSEPIITGDCISSFSFEEDSIDETHGSSTNIQDNNTNTLAAKLKAATNKSTKANTSTNNNSNNSTINSSKEKTISNTNILTDNRKTPIANGSAPPIDGEYLDVKRTYMLRGSTVRKLNELKSIHPELNTYVSTIVDMAIAHYYNHIINEGGTQ